MEDFLADPTVRGVAEAVRRSTGPSDRVVETLRAGDPDLPPLFLVHGAYGDVDSYRALAAELDLPGAVLGLCAQMTAPDGTPHSVADLAAQHVTEVTRRRPTGPIRLAGYSFGGLVAFEMARTLAAAGRVVDFLGLLDPAPPSASLTSRQRRLHSVAKRLALFVPGAADTTFAQVVIGRFRSSRLAPESQTLRRSSGVANDYRWGRYEGPVTYFRAARRIPVLTNLLYTWRGVAPRLTVVDVPGAHHDLLRERGVAALARRLSAALPTGP
jgi:acetoacetyl-CoA synthetase